MASNKATTVEAYLQELPEDRRAVVSRVRDLVRQNLPDGYEEGMQYGMLSYFIPLESYPNTYNGQALAYVSLAAQKNNYSLYLLGAYSDEEQSAFLQDAYKRAGKKLDMGKSCLRFRKLEDLEMEAVAQVIRSTPPEQFIAAYEASRAA